MHHILEPDNALETWLAAKGAPAWRARGIRKWLLQRRADSFEAMTDLPKGLRQELAEAFTIWSPPVASHQQDPDGTEKLLLQLADGERIECVMLRDGVRRTVCISSQVGCAMGCVFCASGLDGVVRNLTSGEIIEQLVRLTALLPEEERISHIVVMGMGEPLANLAALLPALQVAESRDGFGISQRRITISTVGLPPALDRLTDTCPRYHLAVSLHAPDDTLRSRIVPVNRSIGLDAVLAAADRYWEASGRRLTFEYVLLGRLNDAPQQAKALVRLLRGRQALLNVIPYNPVAGLPYQEPSQAAQRTFLELLRDGGVNVQVRRRKGGSIDAACGQLRRAAAGSSEAGEPTVYTQIPIKSTSPSTTPKITPSQTSH